MRDYGTKGLMAQASLLPVPSVLMFFIDGFVKHPISAVMNGLKY
jgi:hypothetical protein